jgi:hypothetical protein
MPARLELRIVDRPRPAVDRGREVVAFESAELNSLKQRERLAILIELRIR